MSPRWWLAVVFAPSCLPADTRPPPSEVLVRFVGSAVVDEGLLTADGWLLSFDEYLVSFGNPTLAGDGCNQYADAGYRRIFDGRVVEPQKVGLGYALGSCFARVRLANPNGDSLLGINVTDAHKVFLRTPGTDAFNTEPAGISVWVKGKADKGGVTKTFAFAWRTRRVQLQDCARTVGARAEPLALTGAPLTLDFHFHPEAPFRAHLDPAKPELNFQPFARADDDGDKNGEVTLDELVAVPIEKLGLPAEDLVPPNDAGVTTSPFKTFADYVWVGMFPQLMTYGPDGPCQVPLTTNPRPGGGGPF